MKTIGRGNKDDTFIVEMSNKEHRILRQLGRAIQEYRGDLTFTYAFLDSDGECLSCNYADVFSAIAEWINVKFAVNEMQHALNKLKEVLNGN